MIKMQYYCEIESQRHDLALTNVVLCVDPVLINHLPVLLHDISLCVLIDVALMTQSNCIHHTDNTKEISQLARLNLFSNIRLNSKFSPTDTHPGLKTLIPILCVMKARYRQVLYKGLCVERYGVVREVLSALTSRGIDY